MEAKTDNELIAEFMGGYTKPSEGLYRFEDSNGDINVVEELQFHSSWDWLMPVVEKINSLNHTVNIYPTKARFYKTNTEFIESIHPGYSLIEVVYCGVVDFIKWYTSQKGN